MRRYFLAFFFAEENTLQASAAKEITMAKIDREVPPPLL